MVYAMNYMYIKKVVCRMQACRNDNNNDVELRGVGKHRTVHSIHEIYYALHAKTIFSYSKPNPS